MTQTVPNLPPEGEPETGQIGPWRCAVHGGSLGSCELTDSIPCVSAFFNKEIGERPGYVAGECGHAVALSEWRAGFRVCEHCPTPAYQPVTRDAIRYTAPLVLRADQVEQAYMTDLVPGWQILDAVDELTWRDITGLLECEDDRCDNAGCVVLVSAAWAAGQAHLPMAETVTVRIPADQAVTR